MTRFLRPSLVRAVAIVAVTACCHSLSAEETPSDKGACCLTAGSCVEMTDTGCDRAGGDFRGDGTTCAETDCAGACCFLSTGSCVSMTQARCRAGGGIYQGDGVLCAGLECGVLGACCLPDGTCIVTTDSTCRFDRSGEYQGAGVECGDVKCSQPEDPEKIACCLTSGACIDATAKDCAALGGDANDGDCLSVSCVGACCFFSGTCDRRTRSRCRAAGGLYQGDGTLCADGCNQTEVTGACCDSAGFCLERTEADCAATKGDFQGADTNCIPGTGGKDLCPTGACCETGSPKTCSITTPLECESLPGQTYLGDGTTCEVDCAAFLPGACCFPLALGASCTIETLADCDALGGDYQGPFTMCTGSGFCPTGACCFEDGSCLGRTPQNCALDNGTYQGDGVECFPDPCPSTGACCQTDGMCAEFTAMVCNDGGGQYNDGLTCAEVTCGACCVSASCFPSAETGCFGSFQGEGTTCDDGFCPVGACCLLNGTCQPGFNPSTCADPVFDGVYQGNGTSCDPNPCPILGGACCDDVTGACTLETLSDCLDAFNGYIGGGTSCSSDTCLFGACCLGASCIQAYKGDCDVLAGAFQEKAATAIRIPAWFRSARAA